MVITPDGKEILISLEEMYQTLCMVNHWLTDPQTAEISEQVLDMFKVALANY